MVLFRKLTSYNLKDILFVSFRIREHLNFQDQEMQEDMIEGEELKRLAAQYDLERKRLEEIRRKEATVLMGDNVRQIDDVTKMKQIHLQQEEVSNSDIFLLLL